MMLGGSGEACPVSWGTPPQAASDKASVSERIPGKSRRYCRRPQRL